MHYSWKHYSLMQHYVLLCRWWKGIREGREPRTRQDQGISRFDNLAEYIILLHFRMTHDLRIFYLKKGFLFDLLVMILILVVGEDDAAIVWSVRIWPPLTVSSWDLYRGARGHLYPLQFHRPLPAISMDCKYLTRTKAGNLLQAFLKG